MEGWRLVQLLAAEGWSEAREAPPPVRSLWRLSPRCRLTTVMSPYAAHLDDASKKLERLT